MLSDSRFCLVALLLIQGALFSNAHPTTSTSLSTRAKFTEILKSQPLGEGDDRKEYTLNFLPEIDQGSWSDTYQIVEPFMGKPAILKVVREDDGKTGVEVRFLKRARLFLHGEAEPMSGLFFMVSIDVTRRDPPFKPFYKWYLENENMDLDASMELVRTTMETCLVEIALYLDLLYFDFSLRNVFLNKSFTRCKPVDWGPTEKGIDGVEEVFEDTKEDQRDEFGAYLQEKLRPRISITVLARILERRGEKLRPADAAALAEDREALGIA